MFIKSVEVEKEKMFIKYQNKDWLEKKYFKEQLQVGEIARICKVAPCTIQRWLNKFKIRRLRLYRRIVSSRIKKLSLTQAAYLAACVDCDGSVCFRKTGGSYVDIGNTDLSFLMYLQLITNGGRLREKKYNRRRGYKPFYYLRFRVKETYDLLPQILPFLVIKKEKAKQLLENMKNVYQSNCG